MSYVPYNLIVGKVYGKGEDEVRTLGLPYEKIRDAYRVSVPDTARVTELILSHPALFTDYEVIKGRMDDVFLTVTGKQLTMGGEGK